MKIGWLKKIGDNKKKQVIFFLVSMFMLILLYCMTVPSVHDAGVKRSFNKLNVITDYKVLFENVEVMKSENRTFVTGELRRKESEIEQVYVILRALDGVNTKYYNASLNKQEVGWENQIVSFEAEISDKNLDLEQGYEILLGILFTTDNKIQPEKIKISTGKRVFDDGVYGYDSNLFYVPEIEDTEIRAVFENGIINYFDEKNGCWVYIYQNEMYIIVNEKFGLAKDKKLRMMLHMYTLDENVSSELMKEGCQSQYFYFEDREFLCKNETEYRIAVIDLPTTYDVTYIRFGLYELENAKTVKEMIFMLRDNE